MKQILLLFGLLGTINWPVAYTQAGTYPADGAAYVQTLKKLTDLMVTDVTGPCAAARYYAYANLAAYEIMAQQMQPANYLPLHQRLKAYPAPLPVPSATPVDVPFACMYAVLRMGEELLPSGTALVAEQNNLIQAATKKYKIPAPTLTASVTYANQVVKQITSYAAHDGYLKTTGYLRYTPLKEAQYWQPTPPGYQEGYEPHWGTLRPFVLDSAGQFKPLRPTAFNLDPTSLFYKLAHQVYAVTTNLTPEQKLIASFWDCNPFFLVQQGHVSYGTKKISPGGHWMGITGIVCQLKQLSLPETIRWHTLAGITMADAFISCWNEKYRSNRIRPETFINRHLDPNWRPLLQTPPFPEYTSGHSVVSAAMASLLTTLAGENFKFTDTSEIEFGLPARTFTSFRQAAREAAISRLYGGIHFQDAIDNGFRQGEEISRFIQEQLQVFN